MSRRTRAAKQAEDAQAVAELPAMRAAFARGLGPEPPHPLAKLIVLDPEGRIRDPFPGRSAVLFGDEEPRGRR